MKALMVMYDSLRRDLLSVYGGPIPAPNFERLAAHTVCFDKSYVGSLPCMPARRGCTPAAITSCTAAGAPWNRMMIPCRKS